MKRLLIALLLTGALYSCDIRQIRNKPTGLASMDSHFFNDSTTVHMLDSTYDFGKVTEGKKVVFDYHFRNTGRKPLIVASARASCGCTVPEKPEEPIQPGQTGSIKVVFNSADRPGPTHKTITVVSNAYPAFPVLQLTGEVEAKK